MSKTSNYIELQQIINIKDGDEDTMEQFIDDFFELVEKHGYTTSGTYKLTPEDKL